MSRRLDEQMTLAGCDMHNRARSAQPVSRMPPSKLFNKATAQSAARYCIVFDCFDFAANGACKLALVTAMLVVIL